MSRPDPDRLRSAFDALAPLAPLERDVAVDRWVRGLELPEPDRQAFAAELRELLAQLDKRETRLDRPITPAELRIRRRPSSESPRIEGFEIVDLIGEGGSSSVYAAVAIDSRRRHAVKVLHAEAADAGELRRFEREVEALSRFAHPFLARIDRVGRCEIDGTPHPYIAMELIDGLPLDAWCRERAPSLAERIELMSEVAEGVHHAHTRGVIHRDLKPANIMVDAEGHPRIIDFGVARWSNANQSRTRLTSAGDVVGTLTYLSPEQASGGTRDVDARSDVHALGLIACEVFSGRRARDFASMPFHAALRQVESEEAARLPPLPEDRGRELAKIVAQATMREPRDRYVSAQAFADDLKRFQRGETVAAPSDDVVRRFRRGIRRYRLAIGASGVAVLVLGGATYGAIVGRQEARAKEAHARAIYQVLRDALVPLNPSKLDRKATVEDVLSAAAAGVDALEDPPPEMEDEVRTLIAHALENTDSSVQLALAQWRRVYDLRRGRYSEHDARTRAAAGSVGWIHYVLGETPQARQWLASALRADLAKNAGDGGEDGELGTLEPFELRANFQLAILDAYDTKFTEACDRIEPIAISELERGGPASKRAAYAMGEIGKLWLLMGRYGDTAAIVEPVVVALRNAPDADPTLLLDLETQLVTGLVGSGDALRALPIAERLAADHMRRSGPDTVASIDSGMRLARCLGRLGRVHEAIDMTRSLIAAAQRIEHPAYHDVVYSTMLAELLVTAGCFEDAETVLSAQLGPDLSKVPERYVTSIALLGYTYLATNRWSQAAGVFERAAEYTRSAGADGRRAYFLTLLANARLNQIEDGRSQASIDDAIAVDGAGDPFEPVVAILAEAERLYSMASRPGDDFEARLLLATTRRLQFRYSDAAEILEGLLAEPLDPQIRPRVERERQELEAAVAGAVK